MKGLSSESEKGRFLVMTYSAAGEPVGGKVSERAGQRCRFVGKSGAECCGQERRETELGTAERIIVVELGSLAQAASQGGVWKITKQTVTEDV